ncbi:hypothetical protein ZYGR_0A02640 [Zygosaccharomyces rouxii]|uniref:ZYRO0A06006p n=2 Tax=Zygosaccharomyces rouxii TaxID=4956 RepID=C5DPT7_ZYGRC|nr:uncharacterized protein ZYRO0A06006g [Zygosaccharomyces rouxii]KAH9198781.1 serine hydrolase-domain-containing protein [Zygosaccharomyces rouxii]GAV46671.1 hypothetical protein ZYGR_0A02640 [Zygosaccharomyces rouxii]CAR25698.1 ZYRO0A06006p [Zygosaccharomyces rouxii]
MPPLPRKKILMLHGFVQSGKIFSSKTGGLRKTLNKIGYDLLYPTSPMGITKEELMAQHNIKPGEDSDKEVASQFNTTTDGQDVYYGWWKRSSSCFQDFDIGQDVWDYLRGYILENGPFEGIMGFSQGGAFAGYLLTNFHKLLNLTYEQQPPLKFFVTFSGFRLEASQFQSDYDKQPLSVPSLHVQGEQDTVVSEARILSLYNSCQEDKRTLLRHPGGHYVPNSKQYVSQVCNWIQWIESQGKTSSQEESKDDAPKKQDTAKPDLGDDLMGTIDSMMGATRLKD